MSSTNEPLLELEHVTKHFPVRSGVLQRETAQVHAVDDVSLTVYKGETLGLVGESGCGKSTLGRTMIRLLQPSDGTIRFDGRDITKLSRRQLRPLRSELQMVFQDPYASLNPRKRVGTIVGDPLRIHGIGDREAQGVEVAPTQFAVHGLEHERRAVVGAERPRVRVERTQRVLALGDAHPVVEARALRHVADAVAQLGGA